MPIVGSKIVPPVSIYDVQMMLGVDNDDMRALCSDNAVNMWARYKPQRKSGHGILSFGDRAAFMKVEGKYIKFGVEVPFCMGFDEMNKIAHDIMTDESGDDSIGWVWAKPRGDRTNIANAQGIKEYARISDFCPYKSDFTDPNYISDQSWVNSHGYNHEAGVPFAVVLDDRGMISMRDSNGEYYEVNLLERTDITFTFQNSADSDGMRLEDLVDNYEDGEYGWRPLLQTFNQAYNDGYEEWYERGSASLQAAGNKISSGQTPVKVSLPIYEDMPHDTDFTFHVVVGVAYCKADGQVGAHYMLSGVRPMFIAPYSKAQWQMKKFPFYYRFKIVAFSTNINVVAMSVGNTELTGWDNYFVGGAGVSGTMVMTLKFQRPKVYSEHFIFEQNGEGWPVDDGYKSLSVKIIPAYEWNPQHGRDYEMLAPTNQHCHIEVNESAAIEYTEVQGVVTTDDGRYGGTEININGIPSGQPSASYSFILLASFDGTDYKNCGSFSIWLTRNTSNI